VIAVDTSSWIAYLEGSSGDDVDLVDRALAEGQVVLPAPVLTELLSDPQIDQGLVEELLQLPLFEPAGDFWLRAGRLRGSVLGRKRKARLADALIAQLCIDHDVQLVTRDRDFHAFAEAAGLSLLAR
jgi:predicted nucleic acid-binding protein